MADDADRAAAQVELHTARAIEAARRPIPAGEPGICNQCGEDMPRLLYGRCAPCRDGRNKRRG